MTRKSFAIFVALVGLLPLKPALAGRLFQNINIHIENYPEDDVCMAVITAETFGTGLSSVAVYAPDGRMVASYDATNKHNLGSQAVRMESPKPYMEDFVSAFPEGDYKFVGVTYEGTTLEGYWTFAHTCLPAPELRLGGDEPIIKGQSMAAASGRIAWTPVDGAVAYDLRIVNTITGGELRVRVPAPKSSFTIPGDWLEEGVDYGITLGSVSAWDNATFTQGTFNTDDF